jgi:signal transduction histidine kinase
MKRPVLFRSIYARFAVIFLGIWWFLNSLTFGVIMYIMSKSIFVQLAIEQLDLYNNFHRIRRATGLTILVNAVIGTIVILIAVRGIVKPIKRISKASKEVAGGNFDIAVEVGNKDETGQLAADFNLMVKELKNTDKMRRDFVSNVSHEFRTPITSIKGFAGLIKDGNLTKEQFLEYSDIIIAESERLSLLSSDLLKLSELDSKMIREQAAEFSLDEQIRKTILILEHLWAQKEIELDIDLESVRIKGSEHLLQEVWLNLIQNAIKFSYIKGLVRIKLERTGDDARFEVTDHGIGISEEDKAQIFERFFKGDRSRSDDGNGLGLVIVKKIVELSGGVISFESELGKGSTFVVTLPL